MDPSTAADVDANVRKLLIRNRLSLLRLNTPMADGPQEDVLDKLVDAGATQIGTIIAPTGSAVGFATKGEGEAYAGVVATVLIDMADEKAGKTFLALAQTAEYKALTFEMVLGEPSYLRAGTMALDYAQVRTALARQGVGTPEIDDALPETGQVRDVAVFTDGVQTPTLIVSIMTEALPGVARAEAGTKGAPHVTVERLMASKEAAWIRRPGLSGLELMDWQFDQGITDAATRMGKIAGATDSEKPDALVWQSGALNKTLVYLYWHDAP